jgi:hypothetical protein
MRTFLACVVLLFFLAGFTTLAEDKAKEPMGKGKVVIVEGGDSKFRFFVWDADGTLLAMSGLGFQPGQEAYRGDKAEDAGGGPPAGDHATRQEDLDG